MIFRSQHVTYINKVLIMALFSLLCLFHVQRISQLLPPVLLKAFSVVFNTVQLSFLPHAIDFIHRFSFNISS